jgi:selenocysteine lyase/cysteine desulfurase
MKRLEGQRSVRIWTSFDPAQSCAIGTVGLEGVDTAKLAAHLWEKRRIIVVPIVHQECQGLRVTPNVYTTLAEVDTFAEEMERVIAGGLA